MGKRDKIMKGYNILKKKERAMKPSIGNNKENLYKPYFKRFIKVFFYILY